MCLYERAYCTYDALVSYLFTNIVASYWRWHILYTLSVTPRHDDRSCRGPNGTHWRERAAARHYRLEITLWRNLKNANVFEIFRVGRFKKYNDCSLHVLHMQSRQTCVRGIIYKKNIILNDSKNIIYKNQRTMADVFNIDKFWRKIRFYIQYELKIKIITGKLLYIDL